MKYYVVFTCNGQNDIFGGDKEQHFLFCFSKILATWQLCSKKNRRKKQPHNIVKIIFTIKLHQHRFILFQERHHFQTFVLKGTLKLTFSGGKNLQLYIFFPITVLA